MLQLFFLLIGVLLFRGMNVYLQTHSLKTKEIMKGQMNRQSKKVKEKKNKIKEKGKQI